MAERAHPADPDFRPGSRDLRFLQERYQYCQPYCIGKSVLDCPCGTGWGSSMLTGAAEVVGLDSSLLAIRYAREHFCPGPQFDYVIGSMTFMPLPAKRFDVLVCLDGFEHLNQSDGLEFLYEANRVLKPDGQMILSCPVANSLGNRGGNPYHLAEYEGRALVGLLNQWFTILLLEQMQGVDGQEYRVVLGCRD